MAQILRALQLGLYEVSANKLRSVLLALSVAVAIATTHCVYSLALQTEHDMEKTIALTQGKHGTFQATLPSSVVEYGVSALKQSFSGIAPAHKPGIAVSLGDLAVEYTLSDQSSGRITQPSLPESQTASISIVDPLVLEVLPSKVLSGQWPNKDFRTSRANPVLVTTSFYETLTQSLKDGDSLIGSTLKIAGSEQTTLFIAGVLQENIFTKSVQSDVYLLADDLDTSVERFEPFVESASGRKINVFFLDNPAHPAVKNVVENFTDSYLGSLGIPESKTQASQIDEAASLADAQKTMALVFRVIAIIVLVIGLLPVIVVSFSSVKARSREISLRQAMGMRSSQTLYFVLTEILVVVSAGVLLGSALGYYLTPLVLQQLLGDSSMTDTGVALALAASAMLLTALVLGLVPAYKAARNDVMQLLS